VLCNPSVKHEARLAFLFLHDTCVFARLLTSRLRHCRLLETAVAPQQSGARESSRSAGPLANFYPDRSAQQTHIFGIVYIASKASSATARASRAPAPHLAGSPRTLASGPCLGCHQPKRGRLKLSFTKAGRRATHPPIQQALPTPSPSPHGITATSAYRPVIPLREPLALGNNGSRRQQRPAGHACNGTCAGAPGERECCLRKCVRQLRCRVPCLQFSVP